MQLLQRWTEIHLTLNNISKEPYCLQCGSFVVFVCRTLSVCSEDIWKHSVNTWRTTVAEGKNTYTTNEVENTVSVPEEPSGDPEIPETPGTSGTPIAPQTGDSGLWMWFALLFVSGVGVMTTTL